MTMDSRDHLGSDPHAGDKIHGISWSSFPRPRLASSHSMPAPTQQQQQQQQQPHLPSSHPASHLSLAGLELNSSRDAVKPHPHEQIAELPDTNEPIYQRWSPAHQTYISSRSPPAYDPQSPPRRNPASPLPSPAYPPPTKSLPPLPLSARKRVSSSSSSDAPSSFLNHLRFSSNSNGSTKASLSDVASVRSDLSARRISRPSEPEPFYRPPSSPMSATLSSHRASSQFSSASNRLVIKTKAMLVEEANKKNKDATIFYLDLSSSALTLATKHGNNRIKFWSLMDNTVHSTIKYSSYTDPQTRSRDYLIRSHAILSEGSSLVAIAVKFGRSVEIWNWTARKCLQTFNNADRWVAGQFEFFEKPWAQVAVYLGETDTHTIKLYSPARGKKPFAKSRVIELKLAKLPFIPMFPEMAISTNSPVLAAAAGPRPPRMGDPPPDKQTILMAWDISEDTSTHVPYKMIRPWEHRELDTAVPCDIMTHGNMVTSIWIPAKFRSVPNVQPRPGEGPWTLAPVLVIHKIVVTWDLNTNRTTAFPIPNTTAALSPDCRYVAYCDPEGGIFQKGVLMIVDVTTQKEVWSWPDREAPAGEIERIGRSGYEQLEKLDRVTELSFSGDGRMLVVGDSEGRSGVYEISGPGFEMDREAPTPGWV